MTTEFIQCEVCGGVDGSHGNGCRYKGVKVLIEKPGASQRQVAGDHYKQMAVQPWDVVDTWPRDQRIGAYRAGALKYLMRMGTKDQNVQEIAKGQHYMEKLLEVLREDGDAAR